MGYSFKVPVSNEEMEELRRSLREEISEEDLDKVIGGNDKPKDKDKKDVDWTCHFCGATIHLKKMMDGPKHMTKCPNNPFK